MSIAGVVNTDIDLSILFITGVESREFDTCRDSMVSDDEKIVIGVEMFVFDGDMEFFVDVDIALPDSTVLFIIVVVSTVFVGNKAVPNTIVDISVSDGNIVDVTKEYSTVPDGDTLSIAGTDIKVCDRVIVLMDGEDSSVSVGKRMSISDVDSTVSDDMVIHIGVVFSAAIDDLVSVSDDMVIHIGVVFSAAIGDLVSISVIDSPMSDDDMLSIIDVLTKILIGEMVLVTGTVRRSDCEIDPIPGEDVTIFDGDLVFITSVDKKGSDMVFSTCTVGTLSDNDMVSLTGVDGINSTDDILVFAGIE